MHKILNWVKFPLPNFKKIPCKRSCGSSSHIIQKGEVRFEYVEDKGNYYRSANPYQNYKKKKVMIGQTKRYVIT
jgi:hypothetical protein